MKTKRRGRSGPGRRFLNGRWGYGTFDEMIEALRSLMSPGDYRRWKKKRAQVMPALTRDNQNAEDEPSLASPFNVTRVAR